MPERTSQQERPVTYQASYDSARAAVLNYPRRAIRMQLGRLAARARTEAQWGLWMPWPTCCARLRTTTPARIANVRLANVVMDPNRTAVPSSAANHLRSDVASNAEGGECNL